MIDIKLIRENPKIVKESCKNRGIEIDVDKLIKIDEEWRRIKTEMDDLRHRRNKITLEINELKKRGKDIKEKVKEARDVSDKVIKNEEKEVKLKQEIDNLLENTPNILDKSVPIGDALKCRVVKVHGKKPKFRFKAKHHWELGEELGMIDLKRAAKIAGAGFYVLTGEIAKLQRALINFMIDFHVKDDFTEINPPQLVNAKTAFGTGNLPKFENDLYKTRENLYLVPTAEVCVTNLHADEVLKESELPKNYVAFTECYRTEAGKHGTETRGIYRLHQFEKVEMVEIVKPQDSWKELESMRARAEKILEKLKIPYRTKLLSSQDTGFASAKTYDIEAYAAGAKDYLEVSSCSNCTDFQARRMNTKYQSKKGFEFVHTLNGSGLALPRLMIALIENNQQKDGSIKVPSALWSYTGFKVIKAKK
jgi:seryl-tRNA synthetase